MATKTELTQQEIQYCTGANTAQFKLWLEKGLKSFRTGADLYDARKFFLWYRDKVYRPGLGTNDDGIDLDVTSHKARYERARAEKYQIRLKKLLDQVVTIDDAELALYEMTEVLADLIDQVPAKLAEIIHEQKEEDILVNTDEFIRKLLLDYSRLGGSDEGNEDKKEEKDKD